MTMTTEGLLDLITELLEERLGDDVRVGRIDGEDCLGFDYDDQIWFIEVKDA